VVLEEELAERILDLFEHAVRSITKAYFELALIDNTEPPKCAQVRELKLRVGVAGKALSSVGEETANTNEAPQLH
jgi:hypothetical protein